MNRKKYALQLLFAFALGILLPNIFIVINSIICGNPDYTLWRYFKPTVFSETQIKNAIEESVPIKIPNEATYLYYAWEGWLDIHENIAMTLPSQKQCLSFIEEELKIKFETFKEDKWSNQKFSDNNPSHWSKKYRGNWNLSEYEGCDFHYYDCNISQSQEDRGIDTYYFPDDCRIFILIYNTFVFEHSL